MRRQSLADLWIEAGGDPRQARTAAAIALAESGGRVDAWNPRGRDKSAGLWQINYHGDLAAPRTRQFGSPELLRRDPLANARAAVSIYESAGNSFSPWTTYTSGRYRSHLADALSQEPRVASTRGGPARARGVPPSLPYSGARGSTLADALMEYARSGGESLSPISAALSLRRASSPVPGSWQPEPGGYATERGAGSLTLPTRWKGTHDTSGADWNQNAASAADIMAQAGTSVGAPEPGRVMRHGSAQGGESLYYQGDSGRTYWIGHIANPLPVGTVVKRRGGQIAVVSPEHADPHVHLDYIRGGR